MSIRTQFEASLEKRWAVEKAQENGIVADSDDVRLNLMKKVKNGEITLLQAQDELKKIKRNASKNGMTTKEKVWRQS